MAARRGGGSNTSHPSLAGCNMAPRTLHPLPRQHPFGLQAWFPVLLLMDHPGPSDFSLQGSASPSSLTAACPSQLRGHLSQTAAWLHVTPSGARCCTRTSVPSSIGLSRVKGTAVHSWCSTRSNTTHSRFRSALHSRFSCWARARGWSSRPRAPRSLSQQRESSPGMQPLPPPVPGPLALLDTTGERAGGLTEARVRAAVQEDQWEFVRRKKTALWFVGALLAVSASILTVGLAATTRTENVTVGGYYPGIILGFGSFLGIIGINLMENRKQMLVAAIVFVSFGVVAAFCCAVVDGVFAARHIEPRPLIAGRCQFHSSGAGYLHDVHQTEVTCHSPNGGCPLKVKSNTCYCCDLYDCQGTQSPPIYHEFVGVGACRDALQLYWLLWASAVLNVLGLLLGVITAAVLGAFKDVVPLAQLAYGPSMAPRVLYDPAQQILACSGFRPRPPAIPTCSSYPLPLQLWRPRGAVGGGVWGEALFIEQHRRACHQPPVQPQHDGQRATWEQLCPVKTQTRLRKQVSAGLELLVDLSPHLQPKGTILGSVLWCEHTFTCPLSSLLEVSFLHSDMSPEPGASWSQKSHD
ncbi:TPA: family with sequence similarity 70, member B-like [Bos taurus]|nr:TPA: family with sequence similarity 70, member B-like [Bos taurus]